MISKLSRSLASASELLHRGQVHEARGEIPAALASYEEAVALLRSLPSDESETRRQLGVAWMNRGNALQKLASARNFSAALAAYDEAIGQFHSLLPTGEPAHLNHLGAAWLNRGHALLAANDFPAAIVSFEQAIAHLADLPLDENPAYRLNLAGAWTNLAHACLSRHERERGNAPKSLERACTAAGTALGLVAGHAAHDLAFAAMSLRARRALVTSLGELLVDHPSPVALAAEASDMIDEGLALARAWEVRGSAQLRPLAARLFRLGAQLYRIHQPHFLAEFLLENLAPGAFADDAGFRAVADDSLTLALAAAQRPQLLVADDPETEKLVATAGSLRSAQVQLSALGTPALTSSL